MPSKVEAPWVRMGDGDVRIIAGSILTTLWLPSDRAHESAGVQHGSRALRADLIAELGEHRSG